MIQILPLRGVPEVTAGANLATLIVDACAAADVRLADGDVVCVAQKVVSKAEDALEAVSDAADANAARREVARRRAVRVIADTPDVLIVETHHGFVLANAGVDASNVPAGHVTVLPEDPDASAHRLRLDLQRRTGARVAVLVTDTFGRPWRMGQTDVAIGLSGIPALRDERGDVDRLGRPLEVTLVALADELAAAADLARRKADGTPFVIVRGVDFEPDDTSSARDLVRPASEDLFRRATTED